MTLGDTPVGYAGPRGVRGTVIHGSVLAALLGGLGALWTTLALVAALLAAPVSTMATLERDGAWGLLDVIGHGSGVLVSLLRPAQPGSHVR